LDAALSLTYFMRQHYLNWKSMALLKFAVW